MVIHADSYDIEDAIVINKSSLDRGYGRCIVLKKTVTSVKQYPNQTLDRIVKPPEVPGSRHLLYQGLDVDGICRVGQRIHSGDVLINKQSPINIRGNVINPSNLPDDQVCIVGYIGVDSEGWCLTNTWLQHSTSNLRRDTKGLWMPLSTKFC